MVNVRRWAVLTSVVTGGAIASCSLVSPLTSNTPEPSNAEETATLASERTVDTEQDGVAYSDLQVFEIDKRFEEGALTLDIEEVQLQRNQIAILIHITNPSGQIIRFYPTEGTLSTGIDEFKANIFLSDDELSGAIAPQERKSGVLVFSSRFDQDLDLTNVTSLQLSLGQVIDMESITPHIASFAFSLESNS